MRNKCFSIQILEVADCCGIGHVMPYVRYVEDKTINEEVIFCTPLKKKSSSKGTDHSGRAVKGMNCLRSLKHWDRGFESN
jgi:hypothetical protein